MPVIELGFPAGRFHATPWGRHVNEGAVEWPPSPWRILRALVATWYLKARSDVSETTVRELIHALASRPALFQLPGATLGHTRHFMPINEGKNEKRTKVFDSFIHLSGSLRIHWDVLLSAQQQQALALLCERLSYLGRAESLVEAKALLTDEAFTANAFPLDEDRPLPAGHELVRLLAPTTDERLQTWLAKQAIEKESALVKAKRGKALKARGAALPQNIFEALHADTGELQRSGWTLPPGGRLLDYIRPENCFDLEPVRLRHTSIQFPLARFAVSSAVLPRITRAVSVAERIHQTLLSRFPNGSAPTVFTGRTHEGIPLAGHRHAFILCEANGNRDSITHVNVFARDGFDAEARRALESLHRVWGHGGHDLQLVLLGFGEASTFADARLFAKAKVWRSLTPFVPTRHPKSYRDGRPKLDSQGWPIGSSAHDLRRLIVEAHQPEPTKIEVLHEIAINSRRLRPLEFQSERRHGGGKRANQPPVAFQITFPEAVQGPLAFGYGTHFGLGVFIPMD